MEKHIPNAGKAGISACIETTFGPPSAVEKEHVGSKMQDSALNTNYYEMKGVLRRMTCITTAWTTPHRTSWCYNSRRNKPYQTGDVNMEWNHELFLRRSPRGCQGGSYGLPYSQSSVIKYIMKKDNAKCCFIFPEPLFDPVRRSLNL